MNMKPNKKPIPIREDCLHSFQSIINSVHECFKQIEGDIESIKEDISGLFDAVENLTMDKNKNETQVKK